MSESEFWDPDLDCKTCDDCEIDILPYTAQWNESQKVDTRSYTKNGDATEGNSDLPRQWQEASYSEQHKTEENETGTFDKIKNHLKSWYGSSGSNLGPLQGGTVPKNFGKMRADWKPPFRDTIQDINFQKINDLYGLDHAFSPPPYMKGNEHERRDVAKNQHIMSNNSITTSKIHGYNDRQAWHGSTFNSNHGSNSIPTAPYNLNTQPTHPLTNFSVFPYMPYYSPWPYYRYPLPYPYAAGLQPPVSQVTHPSKNDDNNQNIDKLLRNDFNKESITAVKQSKEQTVKQNFKDYPAPKPPRKQKKSVVRDQHRLVLADDEMWSKEMEGAEKNENPDTSLIDSNENAAVPLEEVFFIWGCLPILFIFLRAEFDFIEFS